MADQKPTTCSVPECGHRPYGQGLCNKHWQRLRNTGTTDHPAPRPPTACAVPGCGRTLHALSLCGKHYGRIKKTGNLTENRVRNRWIPAEERFWGRVDRSAGPDGCWPWIGARDKDQYGAFGANAGRFKAHAFAWRSTYHGPLHPDRSIFRHSCDNPPCCNPTHLYPGTHLENKADSVARGRHAAGDKHCSKTRPGWVRRGTQIHLAKLTETQIPQIRARLAAGETATNIAISLGVTHTAISSIKRGITWKHIH